MIDFIKTHTLLSLISFITSFQVVSQESTYQYYKYGVEEGLPSSEVYEVLQDKKGYIWLCTDAGVSRFNGYEFENFHTSDGLTYNTVFHIYEDFKGRIWFLPYNGQLCYYENGFIYPYKYNNKIKKAISGKWIRTISIDSNETIHFTGIRYGYGTIDKYGKLNYQHNVTSNTGIVSYYQKNKDLLVYGLKPKKESSIDFFVKRDQRTKINYKGPTKSLGAICQHLISKDKFLFVIGNQLCFKSKDKLQTVQFDKPILNIYVDSKNRLWVSYLNNGIKIYKNINALFEEKKPIKHLFNDKNISGIYEDNLNGAWLAVQNGGVYYIPNTSIDVYRLSDNELTNRISTIHKRNNNDIYVGTFNSKIYKVSESTLPKLAFKNVLTNNSSIFNFSIDTNNKGELFPKVTTETKTKDSLLLIAKQSNFFQKNIIDIDQLLNGTIVGATAGNGILLWNKKDHIFLNLKKKNGLASNIIRGIHIDKDQEIWLSTPKGISHITRNFKGDYTTFNITTKHGLPSNEVNCITSINETIWVATNKGLAKYDKSQIKQNLIKPWVYIKKVVVNEENMPVQSLYKLTYDQNYIEFGFVGLAYRENGLVNYRYRMQGVDKNWIETKTRFVRYPLLPGGNYIFQVQSVNEDGTWSNTESISIEITPPYWKTPWFVTLCLIILVGILVLIFRQREKNHRKKIESNEKLEYEKLQTIKAELKALRSQMNPHFTFNTLSAIQTAVNNSDKINASKFIGDFAKLIRKVLENSKHAFISLEEELEMLQLYIELEQLRFKNKFSYEIIVSEDLDTEYHEIPTMVIQPYIENAILHGLAPKENKKGLLKLTITLNNNLVLCVIEDNGIGRDEAMKIKKRKEFAHNSMATEITEGRIQLYKEDFSVKTIDLNNPKGTRVELTFPI